MARANEPVSAGKSRSAMLDGLGERQIIEHYIIPRISRKYGNILHDDCAVLTVGEETLLFSVDQGPRQTFLENLRVGTPQDIGHFHVTVNVSDIAAMGGQPIAMLLVLALEGDEETDYLEAFLDGVQEGMSEYGLVLLGGDTKQVRSKATTITIIGRPTAGAILRRSGAAVGDQVFVSPGRIGECLGNYIRAARPENQKNSFVLLRPRAQVKFAQILAAERIASSCMDMSDGIFASAEQLGKLNGVDFRLDLNLIDIEPSPTPGRENAWRNLALNVGGDFGLLFTTRPSKAKAALNIGAIRIGEVVKGPGGLRSECLIQAGIQINPYEHFKTVGSISDEVRSFV